MTLTSETRAPVGARERPIIFSGPMVRAILAGRKTQTRRIAKRPTDHFHASYTHLHQGSEGFVWSDGRGGCQRAARMPARVGDRLWVRETWQTGSGYNGPQVAYRATADAHDIDAWDGEDEGAGPSFNYDRLPGLKWHTWLPDLLSGTEGSWRSPIHMPRALSRLTLEVTEVRVERLQDISCADAIAEGIAPAANSATIDCDTPDPREDYRSLWNSIHGKDAWDANPWIAAITFRLLPANESQNEGAAV
ncbi:UNVERIFIED_CONTAM: hypothetical protein Q9R58_07690 [Methylobacteriaceae bacterium AG10]|nr:hypothetical protein [Methylobacteriaceae bacterium AG10]